MNHKEKAKELFLKGYNCSQAVFAAFSDVTGMEEGEALRLSSSFGGGMGHMGEVCGAVSGMFLVAGLLCGYDDPTDPALKQAHYARIRQLADAFQKEYPTLLCRELLKELGAKKYPLPQGADYQKRPCLIFVEHAADVLEQQIIQKIQKNA